MMTSCRSAFLHEQRLSHISLQVYQTIFKGSLILGSSSFIIGTNESFLNFKFHNIGSTSVSLKALYTLI